MKQIDKIIFTLIMFFVSFSEVMAQDYYDTICWVRVNDPQYYATDGVMHSQKAELNSLFAKNGVQYYEKAYPFAKTPELLKIHEIRCETGKDISKLIQSLQENFNIVFDNFLRIEIPDEDVMVYDPVDWMWYAHSNDWLWHLKKIQADLAWDITTGDTAVKTAVIDYAIDVNHPDLASEIYPPYDPYTEDTLPTNYNHGSAVASFVSAETAKQGEVSLGQLASVGFDTKIIAYQSPNTSTGFLQKALHSSTVMGADVIVSCAGGSLMREPLTATGEELVMKEILNNGTVIVMPAGNGSTGTHNSNANGYTEFYPFNSSYDERVIVVTSTDTADCHRFIVNGEDKTHSHFPTVDICAPGYGVFGAQHSQYCSNPDFPYYGNLTGTSFAAPIVAGACALLKSINKDFTPGEIQYFIKSTADPVQDEHDYHGMLGAGRLNIYRAVQKANDCSPIIISSNEIWNEDRIEVCGIEVIDGGCLTIKSSLKLSKHCSFIVHSGGKLIIDGGYLTSLDDEFWPGIEVWGNSSAHQYPVNGHYAQGYVELKNGAVIENAECAIALWRPNHWGTTGGIVHADNATFRNCAKAVHALHYTNHSPINGSELPYNSRFRNCTFAIDEDYLGTSTFYKHIDLDEVNGIGFTGCDFSVVRSVGGVSPWCAGIAAHSAGFSVMAYCDNGNSQPETCPEPQLRRSTFTGFHRGIHASNDGSAARTFTVRNATFDNNTCGIHALNTGFATVIGCDFTVGCGSDCDFGIYADHVTGFCIEENIFRPKQHCTGAPYGILVANSEGSNDIYRNTFNGLLCGNVAVGANHHADPNAGGRIRRAGLTYTCNANSGNQADFLVLDNGGTLAGIQPQQGSAAKPAGNTFSDGRWHLHNGGDIQVTYYYSNADPAQAPDSAKLHNASAVATTNANTCPSHYGGGSVVKSAAEKAALAEDYTSASTVHESLARIYDSKLDGGSTPAETADINTAAPSDLWRLRAKLLGHSPYLSQEALTAAADRHDVFPESVLFEILAANPDELKKDTLIRYMENKANPLPQYMTDLLRQMASGTTARTALLAQMGRYAHERDLAAGDIVRSNLNDTLADHAELRAWLGNMESLAADRLAVASFVHQGDFGSALALAESLPELYGLQGGELNDHNDYMSLLSLYQTLYGEGRNTLQLTEAEAAMVEGIAENGQGASRAMAEALLQGRSDNRVPALSCPTIPEANGGRGNAASPDPSLLNKALGFSASISPNPASTWAAIDYTLPAGATKATLILTNTLGVAVMTAELNGNQGQKVLDLRPLAAGVYGYSVRCGEYVQNGKIVVTK